METDYIKYRGNCKKFSEKLVEDNPDLILVRGYYICPEWGKQEHWWCKDSKGNIVDPTKLQFPSKGLGDYIEFDGKISCANCGKEIEESEAFDYGTCSVRCLHKLVGV